MRDGVCRRIAKSTGCRDDYVAYITYKRITLPNYLSSYMRYTYVHTHELN